MREKSFGQNHKLTSIDKFGVYLSNYKIIRFVKKNRPRRIIDIGCGFNASALSSLKPYAENLTGVDIKVNTELKGIKIIETNISNNLSFLSDSSADLIIMNSVLEHLDHPKKIIEEVHRILDRNGTAIINAPNWLGKYFLEFSAFRLGLSPTEEMNDHKMYYNKKDLWPLLVKAGFKPSRIKLKYHKLFLNTICYAKK